MRVQSIVKSERVSDASAIIVPETEKINKIDLVLF